MMSTESRVEYFWEATKAGEARAFVVNRITFFGTGFAGVSEIARFTDQNDAMTYTKGLRERDG